MLVGAGTGTRLAIDGDAADVEYVSAARAGCVRALLCLIVPALSLANGIESDSVLDVDCAKT